MNERYCIECGELIPEGRIKALPDTETCILHSNVEKKKGFRVISSKTTYTELEIVDSEHYNRLKQYDRSHFGATYMKSFNKDPSILINE